MKESPKKKQSKAKLKKKQADKVRGGLIVREWALGNVQVTMATEAAGNTEISDNDQDNGPMPKPPLTADEQAYVDQCAAHSIDPDGQPLTVPKKKKKQSYAKSKGTP